MSSYRIAWYKIHHPLAYYSAYFDRQRRKGAFDPEMMCGGLEAVLSNINRLRSAPDDACADDFLTTLEVCCEFYKRGFTFAFTEGLATKPGMFETEYNGLTLSPSHT